MIQKMKHGYKLYHCSFLSKKFKYGYVLELLFWLCLGYFFCYHNANGIVEVGTSIAKNEHILSMLIKILMPAVIFGLVIGYTQVPIYQFLEKNKSAIIYKMFPNSFMNFKCNLILTYIVVCVAIPTFCILYMLLFCPTYLVFAVFEFSLMIPMSAFIIYIGLCKKGSFMVWDMMSPILMILLSSICMFGNERFYDDVILHTVLSLFVYVGCVFITFKIINNIVKYMKGGWLQ